MTEHIVNLAFAFLCVAAAVRLLELKWPLPKSPEVHPGFDTPILIPGTDIPQVSAPRRFMPMPQEVADFCEGVVSADGGTWAADQTKARAAELYAELGDWDRVYERLQLDVA